MACTQSQTRELLCKRMRKPLSLLLFVVLSASCSKRHDAPRFTGSSSSVNSIPAQVANASEAEASSRRRSCDFSSYKPIVRPISAGPMISRPQPSYPSEAKEKGSSGLVRVRILIKAESGRVEQACVVEGDEMLADAAKEAALKARFSPYMGGDRYVREHYRFVESMITYDFVLQ
jgi:TonB family protein